MGGSLASAHEKAIAARVLRDAGKTAEQIMDLLGASKTTVYRWLSDESEEPEAGPTEAAVRALVGTWGRLDEKQAATAENLIGFAIVQDIGRMRNANGAERGAAVAAGKELATRLVELGQASGYEDLLKALRDG